MKFSVLLTVALLIVILASSAQAQNAGPMLWTSHIDTLGNYLLANSEGGVVSRFTPGVALTMTRLQLQAAHGSYFYPNTKCSRLPKVRVTDGTTSYALAIPNARDIGPYGLSVHADSGPIAVSFPANADLRVTVVPGETGCDAGTINVTVQYSVN